MLYAETDGVPYQRGDIVYYYYYNPLTYCCSVHCQNLLLHMYISLSAVFFFLFFNLKVSVPH